MYTMVASLNKIILWAKNLLLPQNKDFPCAPPPITPRIEGRDSLDTPDPKDDMPTAHIQSLRTVRTRVQLINAE